MLLLQSRQAPYRQALCFAKGLPFRLQFKIIEPAFATFDSHLNCFQIATPVDQSCRYRFKDVFGQNHGNSI